MEERFLRKVEGHLDGGPGGLGEVQLLNHIIRWAPSGLRREADPCHAEQFLRDLAVPDWGTTQLSHLGSSGGSRPIRAWIPLGRQRPVSAGLSPPGPITSVRIGQ
eukprot:10722373-Alexandrium_andersonii.AAC.1